MHVLPRRNWMLAGLLLATALGSSGCLVNMMALPFYLIGAESKAPPAIELVDGRRDEKRVLVLSYANSGLRFGHDAIDEEIAQLLGFNIASNEKRFTVVPEREVRHWRDMNSHWGEMSLQEIGEEFDVDYVIFTEVQEFSLNETKNQYLLQGKSRVIFRVHDVNKDMVVFNDMYMCSYPPNRSVPLTEVISEDHFRRRFLRKIARDLSWYVVPHRYVDEVSDL
ncbi:hypothetical protein Pan216_22090 [Planctomycetes bacterium Pan216]|uniref:Uncharacterized protein n=1 Tax=Kolteria novifilia TaxID=2527975 RepID=A0A518B2Y1_9BACT|nr:hypothetical protein Pan216_22090 [Planctomycetes bacterium Pan216]